MPVKRPILRIVLALLAVVALAGCGEKEPHELGETEGIYVTLGELKYQIQISRQLNAADIEDRYYLRGLPAGVEAPKADESWFAVFVRVQNETEEEQLPAETFEIVDTQEEVYRPVLLDDQSNSFAYRPEPVAPKGLIPDPDSAAGQGAIQGSLLLFKLKVDTLQNRPLEFKIRSSRVSGEALVDLDV